MKVFSIKLVIYIFTVMPVMLYSAGEHDHSAHGHEPKKHPTKEVVHDHSTHEHSQDLLKSMDLFLEEYMLISEYLASDNLAKAKMQARSLDKAIHALKHKPKSDYRKQLKTALHKITDAVDIRSARSGFYALSKIVIPHVKMMGGLSKSKLFYCPMAFKNKGAQWLQKGDKTRNPYYGKSMLRCGSQLK